MSAFEVLALAGLCVTALVLIYIALSRQVTGSFAIAACLAAGFGAFTAVTITQEGAEILWANHTQNLWGIQVWWDLLFSVSIALFFIVPRARQVGMNIPLWTFLVAATASIALLAMTARLFWLERQTVQSG
ncbi:hypothetical protein [Altererythrobacter sp. GH1-8]|uniref:hypothetical protein n=1 Tax=Altererythrobacter sp. GH1-8 TaxID=3349333 RepID=UPI00374CE808